mmetsp:Transcript_27598/g.64204  ORF Transcript_27598/g.64204 Transcript_27598/m.64204 type:complete len:246 (-) Transcript_27598:572-1309(-)
MQIVQKPEERVGGERVIVFLEHSASNTPSEGLLDDVLLHASFVAFVHQLREPLRLTDSHLRLDFVVRDQTVLAPVRVAWPCRHALGDAEDSAEDRSSVDDPQNLAQPPHPLRVLVFDEADEAALGDEKVLRIDHSEEGIPHQTPVHRFFRKHLELRDCLERLLLVQPYLRAVFEVDKLRDREVLENHPQEQRHEYKLAHPEHHDVVDRRRRRTPVVALVADIPRCALTGERDAVPPHPLEHDRRP